MNDHDAHATHRPYGKLALEMTIDAVIMFFVMYTMIATVDHFRFNTNNVYMTLMMVTPMIIFMLLLMPSMFPSHRLNLAIGAGATLVFLASFAAMRTQAAVGNEQFLRAMIPHHSGAILMCEQAAITDPELRALCGEIVKAQQIEIEQMEAVLARY